MPSVLVVDDSAVDRRLIGESLKVAADLEVEYAVHGLEALEKMRQAVPDIVVTDLIMPEMDGLELVAAVRTQYPMTPIVLTTSKGSEEIVVKALQRGAASYVAKHLLSLRMLDTVQNVLAVSSRQRSHTRLMECMANNECTFVLDNDSALIHPLVTYLQEGVTEMGVCDDSDMTRIGVALDEGLANALYHGNLEVDSELRGEDDEAYHALVAERCCTSPYCDRHIRVQMKVSRESATFVIRDGGPGFDPASLPDPTDPANLEKASGRGLLLMRTFMSEVTYNDEGNTVTLVKRRPSETPESQSEDS